VTLLNHKFIVSVYVFTMDVTQMMVLYVLTLYNKFLLSLE